MKPLGLNFRFDDLGDETRSITGELAPEYLDEVVTGMVGELGYRAVGPATVDGTAYRAQRDVVVEARIVARLGFECVRCLAGRTIDLDFEVRHLLVPRARPETIEGEIVVESDEEDQDELVPYDGENVDLPPLMREDILLELPMNPACGLVTDAECVEPVSGVPDEGIDPRWAPLLELKKKLS